jgi:hypothetical protein
MFPRGMIEQMGNAQLPILHGSKLHRFPLPVVLFHQPQVPFRARGQRHIGKPLDGNQPFD